MATTEYVWDMLNDTYLLEDDSNGTTTAVYTCEPTGFGEVVSQNRSGTMNFYHHDGQGSTRALTDQNEDVTDTATYSAPGQQVASSGSTTNPFEYSGAFGYYHDSETSDLYVRARVYNATNGRWLSVDPLPLRMAGMKDAYLYVVNNSVNLTDPTGLQEAVPGTWRHSVLNEPAMDCEPGYRMKIRQTFTVRGGGTAWAGAQTWQLNTVNVILVVSQGGRCGLVPKDPADRKLNVVDVKDIAGMQSPLTFSDTVGNFSDDPNIGNDDICLMAEGVIKKLGFAPRGTRLSTREDGTYTPNEEELRTIQTMTGAFLNAKTAYVYLNKEACCPCSDEQVAFVKRVLKSFGSNWDDLPSRYESYSYDNLGNWFAFCGPSTTDPCCDSKDAEE